MSIYFDNGVVCGMLNNYFVSTRASMTVVSTKRQRLRCTVGHLVLSRFKMACAKKRDETP
jgi:hypothetical protein